MNPGYLYAALAFGTWGLFPLYLVFLKSVPAWEVVLHRSWWSLLLLAGVLTLLRRWQWLRGVDRRTLALFTLSAVLLAANWTVYVWAVANGHVLDASLGYFINPLVSVLLGVVVLHERLTRAQSVAVALAASGVLWLTWNVGRVPIVALTLALSFGIYGLLRKTARLGALEGLTLETLVLAPVVLPALAWATLQPGAALVRGDAALIGWLLLSGPLTAVPLVAFGAAARRLPLATLGLMQYLSPSIQFVLGVWVFHEPMSPARLVGFGFIWAALLVYSVEGLRRSAAARAAAAAATDSAPA